MKCYSTPNCFVQDGNKFCEHFLFSCVLSRSSYWTTARSVTFWIDGLHVPITCAIKCNVWCPCRQVGAPFVGQSRRRRVETWSGHWSKQRRRHNSELPRRTNGRVYNCRSRVTCFHNVNGKLCLNGFPQYILFNVWN